MLEGFEYKHYKGGLYEFIGIAMPYDIHSLNALGEDVDTYEVLDEAGLEEGDALQVWEKAGLMLVDHSFPCVIYRAYVDHNEREREYGPMWARVVNDFFGHVTLVDGLDVKLVPRFSFQYDQRLEANLTKQTVAVEY